MLRSLANQAAVAIENAQLYQQSIEKRKLDRELRWAGRIQEQLLPERPPTVTGFDIAAQSIPCSEVGGDFYDFIRVKGDRVAFVIADVAGKGVPAALLMATARAALRAHLESTTEPRQLMRRLNRNLCHDSRSGQFVSLFCGVLDPARRIVSYTNAGHNPPLVIRGGRAEPLEKGGMVLGADLGEEYEQADVPLRRGRPARPLHRRRHRGAQPQGRNLRPEAPAAPAAPGRRRRRRRDREAHLRRRPRVRHGRAAKRRHQPHRPPRRIGRMGQKHSEFLSFHRVRRVRRAMRKRE